MAPCCIWRRGGTALQPFNTTMIRFHFMWLLKVTKEIKNVLYQLRKQSMHSSEVSHLELRCYLQLMLFPQIGKNLRTSVMYLSSPKHVVSEYGSWGEDTCHSSSARTAHEFGL